MRQSFKQYMTLQLLKEERLKRYVTMRIFSRKSTSDFLEARGDLGTRKLRGVESVLVASFSLLGESHGLDWTEMVLEYITAWLVFKIRQ